MSSALLLVFGGGVVTGAVPGQGATADTASDLTLQAVSASAPPSTYSPTWSYGTPDPGGSASWDTSTWHNTYAFPIPSTIPAAGVTIKLGVTAFTKSTAPPATSVSAAVGINGDLVPNGYVVVGTSACGNCGPDYTTPNPNSATKQVTLTPTGTSPVYLTVGLQDGPTFTYKYAESQAPPPPPPTAKPSNITGKHLDVQLAGGAWEPLTSSTRLQPGDRLHTGWKSGVTLTFNNGTQLIVGPMTLVAIEQTGTGSAKPRVWISVHGRLQEVRAQVQKIAKAQGDFNVRTPTTTASVRGTKFTVFYAGSLTVVSVTAGKVVVKPKHSQKTVALTAGQEVASTAKKLGPVTRIGKAGAPPGSVGPQKAQALVTKAISTGVAACHVDTTRATLKPLAHGWVVSLTIVGAKSGTATWTIHRKNVSPSNSLAKAITHSCP